MIEAYLDSNQILDAWLAKRVLTYTIVKFKSPRLRSGNF